LIKLYEKILIAIDGSETSIKALNAGVKLASTFNSEVTILSVLDELKLPFAAQYGLWARESHDELMRKVLESLNKALRDIQESLPELHIDARVEEGRPAKAITDIAEKEGFDLIVIGNRGFRLLNRWILGTVSNEVVNSSKIPVLVIK
jgi:nucleotide-binding universal stress UspA family protein